MKVFVSSSSLMSSTSPQTITGRYWDEFIDNLEMNTKFTVDGSYIERPSLWIILYDAAEREYEAEVTRYSDGVYELNFENIRPI